MSDQKPNVAALLPGLAADIVTEERKIPSPGPDQVLIRNHAVAINPIDWKRQQWGYKIPSYPVILGSDVSGVVVKVGPSVSAFKPGDRVLGYAGGFVTGNPDQGAFQTYTIVQSNSATKIPDSVSFDQATTMPQGVGTAALALFDVFGLPLPTGENYSNAAMLSSPNAILVWGAASSVGFVAIQIARKIGLTVFAVASERHHSKLRSLGASVTVDYHSSTAANELLAAAKHAGKQITYAIDTISTLETIVPVMEVLSKGPRTRKLAYTGLWPKEQDPVDGTWALHIPGEDIKDRREDLCAWLFNRALEKWLEEGTIEPIPHQVIKGGMSGIQKALAKLQNGVSMEKVVVEL